MQYMGSKSRISKYIVPIIQSYITDETKGYIEPFVGGANVIDKIDCKNKIGCDLNKYLIALLKHVRDNNLNDDIIPNECTKEHYSDVRICYHTKNTKYDDWYIGLVGFCASFCGRFFDGGYARQYNKKDNSLVNLFKMAKETIQKQSSNLQGIKFKCCSYLDLPKDKIKGYVIYCGPPYKGTKQYSNSNKFDYGTYYQWVRDMSKNNIVICSEYNMPDDFTCIWKKETTTQINSKRKADDDKNIRIEKLYIYNGK